MEELSNTKLGKAIAEELLKTQPKETKISVLKTRSKIKTVKEAADANAKCILTGRSKYPYMVRKGRFKSWSWKQGKEEIKEMKNGTVISNIGLAHLIKDAESEEDPPIPQHLINRAETTKNLELVGFKVSSSSALKYHKIMTMPIVNTGGMSNRDVFMSIMDEERREKLSDEEKSKVNQVLSEIGTASLSSDPSIVYQKVREVTEPQYHVVHSTHEPEDTLFKTCPQVFTSGFLTPMVETPTSAPLGEEIVTKCIEFLFKTAKRSRDANMSPKGTFVSLMSQCTLRGRPLTDFRIPDSNTPGCRAWKAFKTGKAVKHIETIGGRMTVIEKSDSGLVELKRGRHKFQVPITKETIAISNKYGSAIIKHKSMKIISIMMDCEIRNVEGLLASCCVFVGAEKGLEKSDLTKGQYIKEIEGAAVPLISDQKEQFECTLGLVMSEGLRAWRRGIMSCIGVTGRNFVVEEEEVEETLTTDLNFSNEELIPIRRVIAPYGLKGPFEACDTINEFTRNLQKILDMGHAKMTVLKRFQSVENIELSRARNMTRDCQGVAVEGKNFRKVDVNECANWALTQENMAANPYEHALLLALSCPEKKKTMFEGSVEANLYGFKISIGRERNKVMKIGDRIVVRKTRILGDGYEAPMVTGEGSEDTIVLNEPRTGDARLNEYLRQNTFGFLSIKAEQFKREREQKLEAMEIERASRKRKREETDPGEGTSKRPMAREVEAEEIEEDDDERFDREMKAVIDEIETDSSEEDESDDD